MHEPISHDKIYNVLFDVQPEPLNTFCASLTMPREARIRDSTFKCISGKHVTRIFSLIHFLESAYSLGMPTVVGAWAAADAGRWKESVSTLEDCVSQMLRYVRHFRRKPCRSKRVR